MVKGREAKRIKTIAGKRVEIKFSYNPGRFSAILQPSIRLYLIDIDRVGNSSANGLYNYLGM